MYGSNKFKKVQKSSKMYKKERETEKKERKTREKRGGSSFSSKKMYLQSGLPRLKFIEMRTFLCFFEKNRFYETTTTIIRHVHDLTHMIRISNAAPLPVVKALSPKYY